MKQDYSDWYEQNEDSLKERYVDYINQSKAHDIYEYVFWWDWKLEQIAKDRLTQMAQFETWCEATFAEEQENARDAAIEDAEDRRNDR